MFTLHLSERLPALRAEPLAVSVFPRADCVPANLLRFHLRFEKPVEVFDVRTDLRLVDKGAGVEQIVSHPFLDLNDGLWSADGLTLTVMLHPGRIKKGLISNKNLGSAINPSLTYELQIRGAVVNKTNEWWTLKSFVTSNPIRNPLELALITIVRPDTGTKQALTVKFDRVVDQLAIENLVALTDQKNAIVAIDRELSDSSTTLRLTPRVDWLPGSYSIHFSNEFEDTCGNRLDGAFENNGDSQDRIRSADFAILFSLDSNSNQAAN